MVVHKPKAAPPVRMEELRALNMIQLDPDDAKARIEQAQKPKGIIPSGGFTNFRYPVFPTPLPLPLHVFCCLLAHSDAPDTPPPLATKNC